MKYTFDATCGIIRHMTGKASNEALVALRKAGVQKNGGEGVKPELMGGKDVSRLPGLTIKDGIRRVDFVNLNTGERFSRKINSNGMATVGPGDPDFWPGVWRAFFGPKK